MKRFLSPILLMVFLFPSLALAASRGLEMDDLVIREGLYYEKFTDVPFSGKIEGLQRGSFKDGKKDGPWVRYRDDGQLRDKGTFKDGKLHGPWVIYNEDGTVNEEYTGTYKDGVKVE
jgi:antitoxin component YwqK of YwqJK toxin-antitoxin module